MQQADVSNPNDFKVVAFHNLTEFGFTPEMGCMYDGRPINGKNGSPGIDAGETVILPWHIGQQLATNLAKRVLNTSQAATVDPQGVPTGVPVWSKDRLDEEKAKYLKDLYVENKPTPKTETDMLMARVEEYKFMVDRLLTSKKAATTSEEKSIVEAVTPAQPQVAGVYADKQDVLAELEKRGIKHDKRSNKETLEKLLV